MALEMSSARDELAGFDTCEHVQTDIGRVSVAVETEEDGMMMMMTATEKKKKKKYKRKALPALMTLPDIGLGHESCFQALYLNAGAASRLRSAFRTYHINPPGHAPDDAWTCDGTSREKNQTSDEDAGPRPLRTDDLVKMVCTVMDALGVRAAAFLGVGYGAHVLCKLAAMHPNRVTALILVNPTAGPPSWLDATIGELRIQSLWLRGTTPGAVEYFLARYFRREARGVYGDFSSDMCRAAAEDLKRIDSRRLAAYAAACVRREPIAESWCRLIECDTLVVVGDESVCKAESLAVNENIPSPHATLVMLDKCGLLITEEQPQRLLSPIELFIQGLVQRGIAG